MALYHEWDVKNGFTYVLTFFSLISDGLGGVSGQTNRKLTCTESDSYRLHFVQKVRLQMMKNDFRGNTKLIQQVLDHVESEV